MKLNQFMQLPRNGRFGTEVPGPPGILFGQEDTFVLLARKNCPAKLKRHSTAPID